MKRMSILLALALCVGGAAQADVRMPAIFGSHMVLQRDVEIPVWGWADPGERVTVSIEGQQETATTDNEGKWIVRLDALSAGGPYTLAVEGDNSLMFGDVMIGEVWICSGQSNMEMRVKHVNNAVQEIANAQYPEIRLFHITGAVATEPQDDCDAAWERCRPSTVGMFSATGYFFGRDIHTELGVPVGLIHASWGGTNAETWMSADALQHSPDLRASNDRWQPLLDGHEAEIEDYYGVMQGWEDDYHHVIYAGGKPFPPYATPPDIGRRIGAYPSIPSLAYNGMIAPLVPYAIKGAIWYQGESNAGRAYQYRAIFPALIEDWRRQWGQGEFPFLFVQLANFQKQQDEPGESQWAELREAQLMTLALPKTGMAVSIDIGDALDIHPRNKQGVGHRLARSAMHVAYGYNDPYIFSGPIFRSMKVAGNEVRLKFDHVGTGLMVPRGETLSGFTIAGADRKFVNAEARIDGLEIVVTSDQVLDPGAVRYGWATNPDCTLYNNAGLPASPFRTDDWPGVTQNRR